MQQTIQVGYYRVSTERQGRSGLGLAAQRKAVLDYLSPANGHLALEFTEVESGRRKDRPQLSAALEYCRRHKAILLIAKLDRLARNVAFVSALIESRVKFVAVDMPEADVTFLQMAAVFGEWEARKISERTKAALMAAKAKGTTLGWAIPSRRVEQKIASERGAVANAEAAQRFATNILPIIGSIQQAGITSLLGIASALNARGVATARGGRWHAGSVKNVMSRRERSHVPDPQTFATASSEIYV